jgi:hypothetical protein
MLILGAGFVWWHFHTPRVGLALKEPTGFVSRLMWLWFRDRSKLESVPQQSDIASLRLASLTDQLRDACKHAPGSGSSAGRPEQPLSGGALIGGRPSLSSRTPPSPVTSLSPRRRHPPSGC